MAWATDEVARLRAMVLSGATEDDVCRELKKRHADVREMCGLIGVTFSPLARFEWCNCCAREVAEQHFDLQRGFCHACIKRTDNERVRFEIEEEEQRLREEAEERERNRLKKARERMREVYGANPRKGPRGTDEEFEDYRLERGGPS